MRSRAFQTSHLLRQSCESLSSAQGASWVTARLRQRPFLSAALTTTSRAVPRPAARATTKPASTFTKSAAKPVAASPAAAPAAKPSNGAAAAAAAPPPPPAAPEASNGDGNGNGNGLGNGAEGNGENGIDWSTSFQGVGTVAFSPEASQILLADLKTDDIEIKPDGIVYLPEIKYRRILNRAFGPGGWGMVPRGELAVEEKVVTREYALIVHGRFVAVARGECQYFSIDTITTAGEGCKSNALMRCCKDLGIASELWDPRFIRGFKKTHCDEIWVEHVTTKKKRQIWVRKDSPAPTYPYQVVKK